jgi:carbon monoxide dehydrogenase subunit G
MITLLRREFTVDIPLERAWEHLARVEQWPSWAPHIKQLELKPSGELGPQSTGAIHLANGLKPTFRMTEFNPPRSWKWVGRFLWLTVHYDHQFEAPDAGHTKLTWVVQAEGFGAGVLGPLFARVYRGDLDKAIPRLFREMNASPANA